MHGRLNVRFRVREITVRVLSMGLASIQHSLLHACKSFRGTGPKSLQKLTAKPIRSTPTLLNVLAGFHDSNLNLTQEVWVQGLRPGFREVWSPGLGRSEFLVTGLRAWQLAVLHTSLGSYSLYGSGFRVQGLLEFCGIGRV